MYSDDTHAVVFYNPGDDLDDLDDLGGDETHEFVFSISKDLMRELGEEDGHTINVSQIDNKPLLAAMEQLGSMGSNTACVVVRRDALRFLKFEVFDGVEYITVDYDKYQMASLETTLKTHAVDATMWEKIKQEAWNSRCVHGTLVTVKPPGTDTTNKYVMFIDAMKEPIIWGGPERSEIRHEQTNILKALILDKLPDMGCVEKGSWHVSVSGNPWLSGGSFVSVTLCHKSRLSPC